MLIFILAIMIVTGIAILMTNMRKTWIWLVGMLVGNILLIVGFMFYFAKHGGLPYSLEVIFFIHPSTHRMFEYAIVTTDQLSRLLSAGRVLFMIFSAGLAITISDVLHRDKKKYVFMLAACYAFLNYLVFEPVIYSILLQRLGVSFHTNSVVVFRIGNTVYIVLTVILLLSKRKVARPPWLKNKFAIIIVTILILELIFLIFGIFSPLQISHVTAINHSLVGGLYYGSSFSLIQWYVIIVSSIALILLGTITLWRYTRLEAKVSKPGVTIEKRLRENDMGVKVFTHGIKNQLLAQKVLLRNLHKAIHEESRPPQEKLEQYVKSLEFGNEQMLARMDELYNAFKSNRMRLKQIPIKEIYNEAICKIEDHKHRSLLVTNYFVDAVILADKPYLVQAVYNLLTNALDAIEAVQGSRTGKLEFNGYLDGEMIVLEIRDNGVGMEARHLKKIFEPFYTMKNTNYNWGLGLSYVVQTIKAHFGYLRFESKLGQGTTFYVFLPILKGDK